MQAGSTLTGGPLIFARASSAWPRLHNSTSAGTLALEWRSPFAGGGGSSNKASASNPAVSYNERKARAGGRQTYPKISRTWRGDWGPKVQVPSPRITTADGRE